MKFHQTNSSSFQEKELNIRIRQNNEDIIKRRRIQTIYSNKYLMN